MNIVFMKDSYFLESVLPILLDRLHISDVLRCSIVNSGMHKEVYNLPGDALVFLSKKIGLKKRHSLHDLCAKMMCTKRCKCCGTTKVSSPVRLKCGRKFIWICNECRLDKSSYFSMMNRRMIKTLGDERNIRGLVNKSKHIHRTCIGKCGAIMHWRSDVMDILGSG